MSSSTSGFSDDSLTKSAYDQEVEFRRTHFLLFMHGIKEEYRNSFLPPLDKDLRVVVTSESHGERYQIRAKLIEKTGWFSSNEILAFSYSAPICSRFKNNEWRGDVRLKVELIERMARFEVQFRDWSSRHIDHLKEIGWEGDFV